MCPLKDGPHMLLLTSANGNAAALVGGVTLDWASSIEFEDRPSTRAVPEE